MTKRRSPGEGSVYVRADGMHCASLSFVDAAGKRRRKVLYSKTRRGVLEKLREAQAEERAGTLARSPERMTVGQFITHWMEYTVRPNVRPATYANRGGWVNNHILPALGHIQLKALTIEHVERLQADRLRIGLASSTVGQIHVTLAMALEVAVRRGYITRNVARLAGGVSVRRAEIKLLDQEQARALIEAVRCDRFRALYILAVTLGLRKGELLALRWQDLDLDKGVLSVSGSLQRIEGKLVRVETKTAKSNRTLRLPPLCTEALRARRAMQLEERLYAGPRWVDTGYVFTTRYGAPVARERILDYFHEVLKVAGLPRVTLHSLRHSAATIMLANGVQVHVVSRILGHANITTTLNRYSHVLKAMEDATVDIISSIYA